MNKAKKSVAERLVIALDLFDTGVELMRQNLRRRYPDADEQEIESLLVNWLSHRLGAELDDAHGKPGSISRFETHFS